MIRMMRRAVLSGLLLLAIIWQSQIRCVMAQSFPLDTPLVDAKYLTNFARAEIYGETSKNGAIVFDGLTTTQRAQQTLVEQNIGRDEFTVRVRAYVPSALTIQSGPTLFCITSQSAGTQGANSFAAYVETSSGNLIVELKGGLTSDYRRATVSSFVSQYGGRIVDVTVTRLGNILAIYLNGVAASYTESTFGTAPAWGDDVTGPYVHWGNRGGAPWMDRMFRAQIYNFAMSAAEAQSLTLYGVQPVNKYGRFIRKLVNQAKNGDFSVTGGNWVAVGTASVSYDGASQELDVTAPANSDGVKLPSGNAMGLRVGVLHRVEFEIRNESGGITRTVWWGATSIGSATGNGKFWAEFVPTAASADLKIDGNAGNYSLANVKLVEVGSVDGAKGSPAYTSDFSAGVNGWTATAGTVDGNIDSIGGQNDNLRYYANGSSGSHFISKVASGIGGPMRTRVKFSYYIPSANSNFKKFQVFYSGGTFGAAVTPTYDAWTSYSEDFDDAGTQLNINALNASGLGFTGANSVTDDLIYIRGLTVQQIASTTELGNGGFETAGASGDGAFSWWIEAVTGSTALSQETSSANVYSGAGALKIVVDGSGNYGSVSGKNVVLIGQRYRVRFYAKADSTSGAPAILLRGAFDSYAAATLTTSWAQYSYTITANSRNLELRSSNGAGRTIWVDNVELIPLGNVVDLDFTQGVQYQALDRSVSQLHALLVDLKPILTARRGVIRGRTTTSGNQQLCGGVVLPLNARISMVLVGSDASATVNLGSTSGASDIASALSVVSGRNEVASFASRYSATGSVWVNSSGTATLDWMIIYDVVD